MKIRAISTDGFRGSPRPIELELDGRSVSVLAENGFGKTTFADACELWSTGDLDAYHTQGAALDAAVSLDANQAMVGVQVVGHPLVTRTLTGRRVGPREVQGPGEDTVHSAGSIPLLRHRTMTDFMGNTPGVKKQALLKLLGLDELLEFRTLLASAGRRARAKAKDAQGALEKEQQALGERLDGEDLGAVCLRLGREAGLSVAIRSEAELLEADLGASGTATASVRPALFAQLDQASSEIDDGAAEAWNRALNDHDDANQLGLKVLLDAGRDVLQNHWQDESCPLCLVSQDSNELSQSVLKRASAIAEATAALAPARARLADLGTHLQRVGAALEAIRAAPPNDGWACVDDLSAAGQALGAALAEITGATTEGRPYDLAVGIDLSSVLEALKAEIDAERAADGPVKAQARLVDLKERCRRRQAAERTLEVDETVSGRAARLVELVDLHVKATVQAELKRMSGLVNSYYGRLHGSPFYSDVELIYDDARDGGVEFTFRFKGRNVSPPQRVMSESQLGSLGLALFLAQLKLSGEGWRAVVLDDVVNSFDANHRSGLARLLVEEFGNWQVILFTHDQIFHRLMVREATAWRFIEIVQWDPVGGPVLAEGDARSRLRSQLDAGVAASQLNGLARHALEDGLERPFAKLGLKIPYKKNGAYTAYDYVTALREALDGSGGNLIDLPVLRAIEGRAYLGNLSSHYRPEDPGLSTQDLRQLVEDLGDLDLALKCDECDKMVWHLPQPGRRGHYRCECEKLAV